MKDNRIRVIYGDNPLEMTMTLLEKADLAALIPDGASIGLKPNLVVAKPPEEGATTHREILEGTIRYLQEHGFSDIRILEGSWIGETTERALRVNGYDTLSREYFVPFVDTKRDTFVKKTFGGITMEISRTALDLDFLINMPVLKGHCQTIVTGALKNMKGIISDREKRHFHALGLHRPIAYLNAIRSADFVICDGICGDLDFEEGGNPVQMNRIFCGTDSVLCDSYEASLMGYDPEDIEYIRLAAELGVGSADLSRAEILELNRDETKAKGRGTGRAAKLSRYTDQKDACSACYANLIQALARMEDAGKLGAFSGRPVSVGQGFKGVLGTGPASGNCTAGFKSFCRGCPPKTRDIVRYLEEYSRS